MAAEAGLLGGAPDQAGDTDLSLGAVADLPLVAPVIADVDVILDPVEDLLGTDIDVDLDAVADLDGVTGTVGDIVGGLGGTSSSLLDGLTGIGGGSGSGLLGGAPDQAGDTDLSLGAVADLPLVPPVIADVDVNLDPVEDPSRH